MGFHGISRLRRGASTNSFIGNPVSLVVVHMFIADIRIKLKKGVADPEGKNTKKALELLGFDAVSEVKASKFFSIKLEVDSEAAAREAAEKICLALLANPVVNEYSYDIREA